MLIKYDILTASCMQWYLENEINIMKHPRSTHHTCIMKTISMARIAAYFMNINIWENSMYGLMDFYLIRGP